MLDKRHWRLAPLQTYFARLAEWQTHLAKDQDVRKGSGGSSPLPSTMQTRLNKEFKMIKGWLKCLLFSIVGRFLYEFAFSIGVYAMIFMAMFFKEAVHLNLVDESVYVGAAMYAVLKTSSWLCWAYGVYCFAKPTTNLSKNLRRYESSEHGLF